MKKYKVLFCDLDGTLIDTISGKTFPEGIWDMKFKFDVFNAIKNLNPYCVLIVSNQGGIEKGFVNKRNFEFKNDGYLELEKYTPNLINTTNPDFNINTVYTPSDLCYCVEDLFDTDNLIKIWEREKIVITFEEIAKTLNISSDRLAIKMPNGDEISKN